MSKNMPYLKVLQYEAINKLAKRNQLNTYQKKPL